MELDRAWAAAVCAVVDPVFADAGAGFSAGQIQAADSGPVGAILWEAEALRFAERYPDSGIVESYGDQWPAPCIDYWVYVDSRRGLGELSTEGWSVADPVIELTGVGDQDGVVIAHAMARILGVALPPARFGPMSESQNEHETEQDDLVPEDLQPSEDNPLAEGLTEEDLSGEDVDRDALDPEQGRRPEESAQQDTGGESSSEDDGD